MPCFADMRNLREAPEVILICFGKSPYYEECCNAYYGTACNSGENENREIGKHVQAGNQRRGYKYLPEIVSNAACYGYSRNREKPGLFEKRHNGHAE